ncbi:MAG: ParB/RepB/Spo0J family partition protein [Phascolarctobacterium sp.]|uniref:ParB/RepB/Spo0J family partition protein n=1 Tax=Phascolarctobacterium sp. TaxID=2049039 RepID=UPI0026DCEEFE|nr:ParB/RepB/Spo0J family partition protein [Phascolarctobacterium sp.]MDO4922222.1 ParB/RepB/Spo0J family partition protein [Phascolarctobacterium sp.]
MLVDDGFSVLDTDCGIIGDRQAVNEVKVVKVPIEQIFPNPYQPRKTFDEEALADLSASIAQYGVLQPLLVAPAENGRYLLIAGERRLRASRMAALTEVPVIISEYTSQQIAEIALIENLQREDLHYLEEAEGYEQLMEQFHLTQEAMAARVGKKQSTIANKLRLLRLSQQVRKVLVEAELSERHARALLKLEDDAKRLEALKVIIARRYNVRQTEEYIDKLLSDKQQEKKKRLVIVNDVRIYLNSIKQVVSAIKDVGIPVNMEQTIDGDEVVVSLRIKNQKKPKGGNSKPLF